MRHSIQGEEQTGGEVGLGFGRVEVEESLWLWEETSCEQLHTQKEGFD